MIDRELARFIQLKRYKRFDDFIMLVIRSLVVQGSNSDVTLILSKTIPTSSVQDVQKGSI